MKPASRAVQPVDDLPRSVDEEIHGASDEKLLAIALAANDWRGGGVGGSASPKQASSGSKRKLSEPKSSRGEAIAALAKVARLGREMMRVHSALDKRRSAVKAAKAAQAAANGQVTQ